jgi:hypothetical protein
MKGLSCQNFFWFLDNLHNVLFAANYNSSGNMFISRVGLDDFTLFGRLRKKISSWFTHSLTLSHCFCSLLIHLQFQLVTFSSRFLCLVLTYSGTIGAGVFDEATNIMYWGSNQNYVYTLRPASMSLSFTPSLHSLSTSPQSCHFQLRV